MQTNELITSKIYTILENCIKVTASTVVKEEQVEVFKDVTLFLINEEVKNKIKELEKGLLKGSENPEDQEYKGKVLYPYLKLINPKIPAYKYSFFVKKRALEIFDRDKVRARIEGELERFKNAERLKLKKQIKEHIPLYTSDVIEYLNRELEARLLIDERKINEVVRDYDSYDVVITNYAHCHVYPSLYYTLDLAFKEGYFKKGKEKKDYKKENTHLRSGVPNLLWFEDGRILKELRANNKIEKIMSTHMAYCNTIYINKIK